jgi:PAS domain S-box-containing protein
MPQRLLSHTIETKKNGNINSYPRKPITEIIPNGLCTVDRQWTVKYWNKTAEKIVGVSAKDIVGKNLWEEFAGILPVSFYTVYHKAFLQDIPFRFEEYWEEMGAWFEVLTWHGDDTLFISFKSSNYQSHTDRREQPVLQLRMLNELYRFVTEVTNDCLWEWNLESKEIFWIDGGHKRVFGYQIENALIPQSFWERCLHPDDKERILANLNKCISQGSGNIWEDEYRFKKVNGEFAFVHDRGQIIYEKGKATRMIGAAQDITARKVTENQLMESERKLALLSRQTVNALILTDAEGKIIWVNNSFSRISEYRSEDVIGRRIGSFLQGKETALDTLQYLRKKINEKQPFDCEILNYSKTGRKYWIHVQGQPLFNENGICDRYFAIETDITSRILLEDKLANERLAKQKEITAAVLIAQEKERSDIGRELHDNLNQILAVAKLYIQTAKANKDNRDINLDKSLGLIGGVINEIRRVSKSLVIPGTHIIGLFDNIRNLITDLMMVNPVKFQFKERGIEENELNDKLQVTLYRIVQEQLNNILKHANASHASIELSRQKDNVILLITDDGQGCDSSDSKKGLGLINIKSRASLYDGTATIITKPGEGFTLKVVLSLAPPDPPFTIIGMCE